VTLYTSSFYGITSGPNDSIQFGAAVVSAI
jgi:hypothetical protein